MLIEVNGELTSLDRIGRTPIVVDRDGHVVRLDDVAEVRKGIAEPALSRAMIEGQPAVALGVLVFDDRRIDRWSEKLDHVLEEYRSQLPSGVMLKDVFNQNRYVSERFGTLWSNLILGAVGVLTVILFAMGWRSALIVGLALPLSAMMVLTGMNGLGIPIHQMSITGLIIALGLLIDNAIVVVDEVTMALRQGENPRRAVTSTVRRLAMPLVGSTVTTALAFAPIALMNGPAGEFVGSIAVSVILAIFSSLFVSLLLISALAGWSLPANNTTSGWWRRGLTVRWLQTPYERLLELVLMRPWLGVLMGTVLPVLGFVAASQLPEQFFPPGDRDQFQIELELPAQASMARTIEVTAEIREAVMKRSNVRSVDWFLGESAPSFYYNVIPRRKNSSNYAQAIVQLHSEEGARETIHSLQEELDRNFADARLLVRQLEQGPPFEAPVEVRVEGPDLERLREFGEEVRR